MWATVRTISFIGTAGKVRSNQGPLNQALSRKTTACASLNVSVSEVFRMVSRRANGEKRGRTQSLMNVQGD